MTRQVDQNWKKVQETTFTNWVNSVLRGHLKTAKNQVTNLQTDLQDGLVLIQLIEKLASPKKVGRYYKNPTLGVQKLENLGMCFKFFQKENIKLVGMGSENIYDGDMVFILGLIWTLIRKYQIGTGGESGLSTKKAMLAWINTQIPEQKVTNFSTDWNNGVALCALVDRIQPGLCPHYATLDKGKKEENCELGMRLADDRLGIPRILDPNILSNPDVDDISVMTYLSYFFKPANQRLMTWVQSKIPDRKVTNFTTDWNNGINLACLVDSVNPGVFSNARDLDPHDSLDNLVRAMRVAEDHLAVKPIIKPSEMADPLVDELNVATYLFRFQYAKPVPQPHEVTCSGHGLHKAFVGRPAEFEVQASRAGVGDLVVTINGPGRPFPAEITASKEQRGVFTVQYVPQSPGKLSIDVKWSGFAVPSSPFSVDVLDPASLSFTGAQITGGQSARVGQPVVMQVKGLADVSDLYVMIQHQDAHSEVAKIVPKRSGEAEVMYTPVRVGKDEVFAKIAGTDIPGSPFEVKVVDPSQCSVSLKDPPPGKPLAVNQKASFVVNASDANFGGIVVEAKTPAGIQEVSLARSRDGTHSGTFTPIEVGAHAILVTCGGENVRGSPLDLLVSDSGKCIILDAVPQYMQVGGELKINISTKHAGDGRLDAHSANTGILKPSLRKADKDLYTLVLHSTAVGESTIDLKWNEKSIPQTPFTVSVCDAGKCSAYGRGLTEGKGKVGEKFEFTVQTSRAGKGELIVKPKGPKSTYKPSIKPNHDDTYTVDFTTYEQGPHSIEVLWGDVPIANSPYKVQFTKGAEAGLFTASGEGLKTAVALEMAKCMLVGPESGLVADGVLAVEISGEQLQSTVVEPSAFNSKCGRLIVSISDNGNGSYAVQYAAPKAGTYSLSITSDGEHIPGSPFRPNVLPPPDASKCQAYGPAIDNPKSQVIGKPLEFKVDSSNAGTGQLSIAASSPASTSMPVYLADDQARERKRVHNVKIEPKVQGKHTVHVLWAGQHIPGSPFNFEVSDPKNVTILYLPDSQEFTARVGEAFTFAVDPRNAGQGEVKAAAQRESGRVDPFEQKRKQDGTIELSYTPRDPGKMELLLTFSGVSLLHLPWTCDIVNPGRYHIVPPKGYGRQREYVKFVVGGLTQKKQKEVQLSAVHKDHNAAVKVDFGADGQAVARFTAKMVGPYTVEAKCAKKHVQGSPFTVQVANPEGCTIKGKVPEIIPVGQTRLLSVDTTRAGPGELTLVVQTATGETSDCLDCNVSSTPTHLKKVNLKGLTCAECDFTIQWAGYALQGMPVKIKVVDPEKCTFDCPQAKSGQTKQGASILVTIDTSEGGMCSPEVVAKGPKATYPVDLREKKGGKYTATFDPWQDGNHTLEVCVGGVHVSGSPLSFEVLKPIDPTKISVSGAGLKQAVARRPNEVTVFARESKLFDKGLLSYEFMPEQDGAGVPEVECQDNGNGTYKLTYIPHTAGSLLLKIQGEGKAITGSPFNIKVQPEPNAQMCKVSGLLVDRPDKSYLLRETVELTVDSTDAGFGTLALAGAQPNGSPFNVFTREERVGGKELHFLKFDAAMVGTYTLSAKWDNDDINGSPYTIQVVDPSKCTIEGNIPRYLVVNETDGFQINTSGAGTGKLEVSLTYMQDMPPVEASIEEKSPECYQVNFSALEVGEAKATLTIGQQKIPKTPFVVTVCNPSKCTVDGDDLNAFVGVPLKFPVLTPSAGPAPITVKLEDPDSEWKADSKDLGHEKWEVSCTASSVGQQRIHILCGNVPIPSSPVTVTASDPKKCTVSGLHQNHVGIMGHPITFSVDYSQAGDGKLQAKMKLPDESLEEIQREDKEGKADFTYIPHQPGQFELVLKFNGQAVLPLPWVCTVTDPSRFQVTPPGGYAKLKDTVSFSITGIKDSARDISVMALHDKYSTVVKTDPSSEPGTIVARFVAQSIGDYTVHVKHLDQQIHGSPFKVSVANPDGCTIFGRVPNILHIGEQKELNVDSSNSGPGELTCTAEDVSGELEVVPDVLEQEEGMYKVTIGSETVGKSRIIMKWADFVIPQTPFEVSFVDAGSVKWSCPALEDRRVKQGDGLEIQLDCREAGKAVPEVKATGPKTNYPAEITDNKDGTFTATFHPWQIGNNSVEVLWGGKPIPSTPINYTVVKAIEAKTITASGDGLESATAGRPAKVKILTPESGLLERGDLKARFDSDAGADSESPHLELEDQGDGIYLLTYTAPVEGKYHLSITCEGEPIAGSPFTVRVHRAPSASQCRAFGGSLEAECGLLVIDPVQFSVDTTDAGWGHLTVTATQPNNRSVSVYALEENKDDRRLHHLKFDPEIIGHHTVNVLWEDEHIPGSPFDFNIISPSKCKVDGLPLPNGIAQLGEDIAFTVSFKDAGCDITPEVFVNFPGKGAPVSPPPTPVSDGVLGYTYTADSAGRGQISVQYGGHDVIGSPFQCHIIDSSKLYISELNLNNGYAYVCDPVSFSVIGQLPSDQRLSVAAHGPSNDPNVDITEQDSGIHVATFVPAEPGSYEVYVECAGTHVSGSPFTVHVADWSKCQVLGDIPTILQVGKPVEFVVKTRSAGAGELTSLVDQTKDNPIVDCTIEKQASDSYGVTLLGKRIGEVKEIELMWAGHNISQCPFKVTVCDATQCKVYGQAMKSKRGKVSEAITFTVVTLHAGNGDLAVVPRGPSAQYNVDIQKTKEATYEVSFIPWEVGRNFVEVLWGGAQIPKSPFLINVESPTSASICNATGEGLSRAIAGEPATFTVISNEIGLLDKNAFKITIFGPGVQATATVKITDNNNGMYTVQYTAPVPGGYIASISFYDRPIPGSPFKVNVVPGPDASKCRAYGAALHPNATNISGTLEFYVDTSKGGDGNLKVYIQGPNDYRPEIYMAADVKKKGVHCVKFDAKKSGRYMVLVLWSKQHIPGSPFKLKVHPQPDAGKVRAYGPGLEGGVVGDGGDFTVETKNAGLGTLLIRVHGLKDSFKVEATPKSLQDQRTLLAKYHPQLPGEYAIFVRWSGEHVPGSPFKVTVDPHIGEETTTDMSDSNFEAAEGFADGEDEGGGILDSTFAQRRPKYDVRRKQRMSPRDVQQIPPREVRQTSPEVEPQVKKKTKKEQAKAKDKKKEKEMPRSQSGDHVGPVLPSLKMKPMASLEGMTQPYPPQGQVPRHPAHMPVPQRQSLTGRPGPVPNQGLGQVPRHPAHMPVPQRQSLTGRPGPVPNQGLGQVPRHPAHMPVPQRQSLTGRPGPEPNQGLEVIYLRTPTGGYTPVYIQPDLEAEPQRPKRTPPTNEKPAKKHQRGGSVETGVPRGEDTKKHRRSSSSEAKLPSQQSRSSKSPKHTEAKLPSQQPRSSKSPKHTEAKLPSQQSRSSKSPKHTSSGPQAPPSHVPRSAGHPRADSKKKK